MIATRRKCAHCGVGLVRAHTDSWCRMCQNESRRYKGKCSFCDNDIADYSACWDIRRRLDVAYTKGQFPDYGCPSCYEVNGEKNPMEVTLLETWDRQRQVQMICTVCHTTLQQTLTLYTPPPKGKS